MPESESEDEDGARSFMSLMRVFEEVGPEVAPPHRNRRNR